MIAVTGNSPLAKVVTVLLSTRPVLEAVITIGLSMTPAVRRKASCLVTMLTTLAVDITLTPIVIGGTLLNITPTRLVRTLGPALRTECMLAAPRVASVATVSTLNML